MIDDDFKNDLNALADSLAEKARYRDDEMFGPVPADLDLDSFQWGSVVDAYGHVNDKTVSHTLLKRTMGKEFGEDYLEHAQDQISEEHGIQSFAFLSQGTGTVALLGQSDDHISVLRITAHPNSAMGQGAFYNDTHRSGFPGLLQEVAEPTEFNQVMHAEIMPLGQIVELSEQERTTYLRYLSALTEGTVFNPSPNEVMVLPNGTPLLFDPGEAPYSEAYQDMSVEEQIEAEQQSLALVQERLETWDIPDALKFTDADGGLKQDQFFKPHENVGTQSQDLSSQPAP